MVKKTILLLVLLLFEWGATGPGFASSGVDSVVIGSLKGTLRERPHHFIDDTPAGITDQIEFKGFRLVNRNSGKSFFIRPLGDSLFRQDLPPGNYDLVRMRYDRPDYRGPKMITILSFEVPSGSLVNLGTIAVVLDGPPEEKLTREVFTYRFHYRRSGGSDAYAIPIQWFSKKYPEQFRALEGRIIDVASEPTQEPDSSKVILRKRRFLFPRGPMLK